MVPRVCGRHNVIRDFCDDLRAKARSEHDSFTSTSKHYTKTAVHTYQRVVGRQHRAGGGRVRQRAVWQKPYVAFIDRRILCDERSRRAFMRFQTALAVLTQKPVCAEQEKKKARSEQSKQDPTSVGVEQSRGTHRLRAPQDTDLRRREAAQAGH